MHTFCYLHFYIPTTTTGKFFPVVARLFSNSDYKVFNTFRSFLFKAFLNLTFSFSICSFSRFSSRICSSNTLIRFFSTMSPMYLLGSIIPACCFQSTIHFFSDRFILIKESSGQSCPLCQFWDRHFFPFCQHLPDFCHCPVYFFFTGFFIAGYHRIVFVHILPPILPDIPVPS